MPIVNGQSRHPQYWKYDSAKEEQSVSGLGDIGKTLIILGIIIVAAGILLMVANKIPWIGKLPGDIFIKKGNFTFYFPIVTCILLSIILSLLFSIFRK